LSTIKVYGETPAGVIDERTPLAPETMYAATKREAESIVLEAKSLNPVVLRLCPVYGPGDKGNVRALITALARRRFAVPGAGSARKSIVHVSSVVDAVVAAALQPIEPHASKAVATGAFVVADRFAPSMRELADAAARALGAPRPVSLHSWLLRHAANWTGSAVRALGRPSDLHSNLIVKAMTPSVCSARRIEQALGIDCRVDLDAELADEVSWLRRTGSLA